MVFLEVAVDNDAAARLYEAHGLKKVGVSRIIMKMRMVRAPMPILCEQILLNFAIGYLRRLFFLHS